MEFNLYICLLNSFFILIYGMNLSLNHENDLYERIEKYYLILFLGRIIVVCPHFFFLHCVALGGNRA